MELSVLIPRHTTVTHIRLLVAVNTDLPATEPIGIVDVGCGTGKSSSLISYRIGSNARGITN